ncbi:venom carboxylesterase-6-like [Asbolus verrucosus]|uniref:Carboxylic ester hydrolase n=1 Tax=Asbolus verrucosus TaxID=1661398 RepID=A0A482VLY1_ASBVE|nr:venom carboxylesterase-6-like [Asbolus verrucosus]
MKAIITFVVTTSLVYGQSPPLVNIPTLGTVEGGYGESLEGRSFYAFEGVPYARPPVGKYRFREPTPLKPWHDIWTAKTIYKCMQYNQYTPPGEDFVIGDEDCLYLNIYTPRLDQNAKLDVIVYIHGGAFMFLYGGFQGPQYIMDKDIVYVNLNYRLGPLGFLSAENEILPGNNGMKDQIFALQWIQENVKYFGGNPNSVTIFGMSAGGASIHFHYLSPKSRGLFHRGISQSGTMLNPWVLVEKPLEKTKKLAANVGCSTKQTKSMVECLKRRPAKQIVASVKEFQPWLYNPFSPFGLVVDSWSADPVLPSHPYNLIRNKQVADLPWIASFTSSEGLYPAADFYGQEEFLNDIDVHWNELLPFILDYNNTVDPELLDQLSQKIRKHYLGDKKVSKSTFLEFVKILTDRIFAVDIQKAVRLQSSAVTQPVYLYYFTHRGAHSKSEARSGTNLDFGAAHGDDTSYIFKTNVNMTSTEDDKSMVQLLVELVTSYAKTGKPNVPIEWPALSKNVKEPLIFLKIASPKNLTIEREDLENAKFWESLPIKENEKLGNSSIGEFTNFGESPRRFWK